MEKEPNLQAKKLVEKTQERFRKKTVEIEWEGTNRVPKEIKIEGETKQTQYMRDGIITFTDGTSATYERLVDYPESPQKIRLTYASRENKNTDEE